MSMYVCVAVHVSVCVSVCGDHVSECGCECMSVRVAVSVCGCPCVSMFECVAVCVVIMCLIVAVNV